MQKQTPNFPKLMHCLLPSFLPVPTPIPFPPPPFPDHAAEREETLSFVAVLGAASLVLRHFATHTSTGVSKRAMKLAMEGAAG